MIKLSIPNRVIAVLLVVSIISSVFTGVVIAAEENSDDTLVNNGVYWVGQTLERSSGINPGETVEIREVDEDGNTAGLETQVTANDDGVIYIDTENINTGSYILQDSENNNIAEFEVVAQNLSVITEDDGSEVENKGGADETTLTLEIDSNRATYDLIVSNSKLDNDDLEEIFNESNYEISNVDDDEHEEFVLKSVTDGELDANFDEVNEGKYQFDFNVVDSTASSSLEITVGEGQTGSANFAQTYVSQEEGDVIPITVQLSDTDQAELRIGNQEQNYQLNVSVTDKDNDGVVTVLFNTYTAGRQLTVVSPPSKSEDTVKKLDETTLENPPLDAASYEMDVYVGNDLKDTGTIQVKERQKEVSVQSFAAPTDSDFENATDVSKAIYPMDQISQSDTIVIQFEASSINGYVNDEQVSMTDILEQNKDGRPVTQDNGFYVTASVKDSGVNQKSDNLNLSDASLYTNGVRDKYYVVIDDYDIDVNNKVKFTIHFEESNFYYEEDWDEDEDGEETYSDTFTVVDRKASFYTNQEKQRYADENNPIVVEPNTVNISGRTNIVPGSKIDVFVKNQGKNPFYQTRTVTVSKNQTFTAEFNFSDIPVGTTFFAQVDGVTDKIDGVVREESTSKIEASSQEYDSQTQSIIVDSANLRNGGFLVVKNMEGKTLATSDYLTPGEKDNIQIALESEITETTQLRVVAYQDDGDKEFTTSDTQYSIQPEYFTVEIQDVVTVTVTKNQMTEQNPTPEKETVVKTVVKTVTKTPNSTTNTPGQPGFNAVIGIVAVLLVAGLAVWRMRE